MIANNVFRAIADFFVNVFFEPFDSVRFVHNWWIQNTFSWILILIAFTGAIYWLNQLRISEQAGEK